MFIGLIYLLIREALTFWGVRSGSALKTGKSRVGFPMGSLGFFIDLTLSSALWPLGRLIL